MTTYKGCLAQELIRDSVSRLLLGDGDIGRLCLAHTRIPDSQKERRCSEQTILFGQTVQAPCAALTIVGTFYITAGSCLRFQCQLKWVE